ncbi:hypothetical protein FB451DRAFT_300903 [Mycena latifolia]|nr:hypothetical protein FB451DRAFT_300903 [Mycena latifolia]
MQLGQFFASVSVDGAELSEYAVECSADGTEAKCWIPSQNGKQFRVDFKNMDAREDFLVEGVVTVDGIKFGGRDLKIRDRGSPHVSTSSRDSVAASPHTRRPLTFSKQALTDDDAYLNANISPHLGIIKVVFAQVPEPLVIAPGWIESPSFEPSILHERSKEATGHSVQLGPQFRSRLNVRAKPRENIKELVTFIFKYRPIEFLRAEGIAPPVTREERAVAPTDVLDLSMDVDTDEEDKNEIEKLEARLVELKNKNKRVKREPSEGKKKVKIEGPIFKPGEVIDLT